MKVHCDEGVAIHKPRLLARLEVVVDGSDMAFKMIGTMTSTLITRRRHVAWAPKLP